MSGTARVISTADVFARVGVRDPYFGLRTIAVFRDGRLEAEVPVELKSTREAGPITSGEAMRHLEVLAACALAEVNPDRSLHYYVTRTATLARSSASTTASRLEGAASAQMLGTDAGRAQASLHARGGAALFELDVELSVFSAARFEKVFQALKRDLRKSSRPPVAERLDSGELKLLRANPYGAPLVLSKMGSSPGADVVEATFGPVPEGACKGHFPMYPVLPSGIVMSALSQLAGELLRRRKGEAKYLVRHANSRAESLAMVGETIRFEARYVGGSSKNHRFECHARSGARQLGFMSLTLQLT